MKENFYPMRAVANLNCVWHRVLEKQMADLGLSSIQSRVLGYLYFQLRENKSVFQKELEQEYQRQLEQEKNESVPLLSEKIPLPEGGEI